MTEVARLEAILTANTSQYTRKMREAEGQTTRMGGVMNKAKLAAVGLGVGGVAVAAKFLETSVKAAMDAQKSQVRLEQAFKASHMSAKVYGKQLDALEKGSRKLGFSDEDVKNSLGSLLIATHSMKKASADLSTAQDIARFKNISLEAATKMLTMAQAGSQRATKQLGLSVQAVTTAQDKLKEKYHQAGDALRNQESAIKNETDAQKLHFQALKDNLDMQYKADQGTAKMIDHSVTSAKVIQLVNEKLHGQADAYSKTAAGGMAQFHAQVQHIEVAIGTKLLPAMAAMFTKLNELLVWSQENWPRIRGTVETTFRVIVSTIKGFYQTIADLVKFWNDLLHGRWSKFWDDIKNLALDMVNPLHLAAGKIARAVWSGFTGALEDGWKGVKGAISGLFGKVIGWVKDVLGIASPSTVFHEIGQNAVKGFINGVGSMAGVLKHAVVHMAEHAATNLYHAAGGLLHGGAAHGSQQNRNIGQQLAAGYGWGSGAQWMNLDALFQRESGWSNTAKNPSSGAYGIPQALPESKLPPAGRESGGSHAAAQIAWGLNYIRERYGSPVAAMAHEQRFGWYDKGGWLPTGLSLAMNNTGKPERIVPPGSGEGQPIVVQMNIDGNRWAQLMIDPIRRTARLFEHRNGRPAFGGM